MFEAYLAPPIGGMGVDYFNRRAEFRRLATIAMASLACALAAGCGRSGGRLPVNGSVTVDGRPLASGAISFQPVEAANMRTGGALIRDGRYELTSDGGLSPGEYLVEVQGERTTGRTVVDPQRGPVPELVAIRFAEFERRVRVSPESDNIFDFALRSTAR